MTSLFQMIDLLSPVTDMFLRYHSPVSFEYHLLLYSTNAILDDWVHRKQKSPYLLISTVYPVS